MKKLALIFLAYGIFAIVGHSNAFAQQMLRGTVINIETQKPVAGANVTYGDGQGTSTDGNGEFSIPCDHPLRLTVSHIAYQTVRKEIESCDESITISLQPHPYSMQNITVENRAYIEEASSIEVLNVAELKTQTGLRLESALNTVPGVQMQSRSPWGGQRITIRGYYPNAGLNTNFNGLGYQLYYNDIPVTDASGTTIMDDIDFANLGSVKIIKGPSPLYGNEIAGTVLLHTQLPQESGTALSEQLITGSNGLFRNNTSLMTKNDNMEMRITYGNQSYDSFRPHDSSKKDYLSITGNYQVSESQRLGVYFSYNNSDEQLAGNINKEAFNNEEATANPDYVNNDGGVEIESFRAGITSTHTFNSLFANKTTVFASGHTLDQNFAHGFNYYKNLNFGARTNFTFQQQLGNVGVNGQLGAFIQKSKESVDGVFIPPFISAPFLPNTSPQFPTNQQNSALNYNIFTKWEWSLPYELQLSVGGIVNVNRYGIRDMLNNGQLYNGSTLKSHKFDPTFSPSVSVLKSFGQNNSVYASITTGNTPPLLSDILAGDGSVNEGLKPEDAIQYEIGSKGNLINGKLAYKIALFDLEIKDKLATQYRNDVAYTTNVGQQQNRGVEASLSYNIIEDRNAPISLMRLWTSYTYSDFSYSDFKVYGETQSGGTEVTANYTGNAVAGVAPHMLNIGLNMRSRTGLYLNAKYRFMDETPITFNNDLYVKDYSLLNVRLGYKKELGEHFDLDAFVGSNNLTGSTYYKFLFVGQSSQALGDGYISPAPYDATFYGGLTLKYTF